MKILNKAQVNALFQREAVLIGTEDGVTAFRAAELFGDSATEYVKRLASGQYFNGYGVGDYTLDYLTFRGFQVAASFYNVQQLREMTEV